MKINDELDKEITRLDLEGAVYKDVLTGIFRVLEDTTASGEDIKEVSKQIRSLRKRIEDEGTQDRDQLSALVKALIGEIRERPEPITHLDVTVDNPVGEVELTNKKLKIEGKVETKEGSKQLRLLRLSLRP